MHLGSKILELRRQQNITQEELAAAEDEMVKYLIACYTSGFYGDCADATCLVSVAPTEEDILAGLCSVLEKYAKD